MNGCHAKTVIETTALTVIELTLGAMCETTIANGPAIQGMMPISCIVTSCRAGSMRSKNRIQPGTAPLNTWTVTGLDLPVDWTPRQRKSRRFLQGSQGLVPTSPVSSPSSYFSSHGSASRSSVSFGCWRRSRFPKSRGAAGSLPSEIYGMTRRRRSIDSDREENTTFFSVYPSRCQEFDRGHGEGWTR